MKRKAICLIILLTAGISWQTVADSSLDLQGKLGGNLCLFGVYPQCECTVLYNSGLLGLGGRFGMLWDPFENETYPYILALLNLGVFQLGGGMETSLMLPVFTLGLNIPTRQLGPGRLGFIVSADWLTTVIDYDKDDALGLVVRSFLGSSKLSLGITYTFPLFTRHTEPQIKSPPTKTAAIYTVKSQNF